jgi:hypothetical protein
MITRKPHNSTTNTNGMPEGNTPVIRKTRPIPGLLVIAFYMIDLFCGGQARAQFAVQPMVLSLKSKPGTEVKTEIRLQNLLKTDAQHSTDFEIRIIDLIQSPDGQWLPIGHGYSDSGDSLHPPDQASCRSWLYPGDGFYEPGTTESHDVVISVPEDAQGFYWAAFSIKISRSREYRPPVTTDYEFIVPIMVEVEGPSLDHAVHLTDAGLEQNSATQAPSTLVSLDVENQGPTLSQLTGFAHIHAYEGEQLGPIKHKITFDEASIIPGARLRLRKALPESLPSGRYRVLGDLSVDDRLIAGISRDIELAGRSTNLQTAPDSPMRPQPVVEPSRISNSSDHVSHYLLQVTEPEAPINQTIHYAIKSSGPTVAIMKQKAIKVSQDGSARDPYHTYSGSGMAEFFTNIPVHIRASAVATSPAEGNWTCTTDPGSICGHMNTTLYARATDVRLEKLVGGTTNLEVARITVMVIPRL